MPKLPPEKPRKPVQPLTEHPRGILREWPPSHCYSDGAGGLWTHQGTAAECRTPDCVAWRRERAWERKRPSGDPGPDSGDPWTEGTPGPAPWGFSDEHVESWAIGREPEDPRPDPLGPCPVYGKHRWRYVDDENGHSGDVCKCGAFEE